MCVDTQIQGSEPKSSTRLGRRVLYVIALILASFGVLLVLLYPVAVLWIPARFLPPETSSRFPFFTYVDAQETVTGEPVNLVVLADYDRQLIEAFQKAGLIHLSTARQERISAVIGGALLEHVTPISPRYLFGRVQDFGFQTPSDSVAHRHHLRVWRWDDHDWDSQAIWLVSASYDKGVGIEFLKFLPLPTHIVAPNIDDERDFFADLLMKQGLVSRQSHAPGVGPFLFKSNGDGSFFLTDGEVLVIQLRSPASGKTEVEPWPWPLLVRRAYFRLLTTILQFLGVAQFYDGPASVWLALQKVTP